MMDSGRSAFRKSDGGDTAVGRCGEAVGETAAGGTRAESLKRVQLYDSMC